MIYLNIIKPRKVALIIGGLALILGLAWFGAYWWANQVSAQALLAVEQLAIKAVSKSEVLTFTKLLDRTAAERILIDRYFINSETVADFLSDLDRFGRESGAVVEVVEVAEDQELFLAVQLNGRFSSIVHFVSLVEQMPYLIEITGLKFSYGASIIDGRQSSNSAWTARANLTVKSFDSEK